MKVNNSLLKCKLYKTIEEIPKDKWDALRGNSSITLSYQFWKTVEKSEFSYISNLKYIVYYYDSEPVALIPCYTVRTDITIFSGNKFKSLLNSIRNIFPNFLTFNLLECGSPVTVNTPQFLYNDKFPMDVLLKNLKKTLIKLAFKYRSFLIIIRDFESNHDIKDYKKLLRKIGFAWLPSFPNTYLDIRWSSVDEYYKSLRSHYRYKLKKYLKINSRNNISHKLVDDFDEISEQLCRQWLAVHNKADELKREILTSNFYKEFSNNMGEKSKVLLFYKDNKLCAHALLLKDNETLRWMYVGRENPINDSLYFYIVDKIVETAIHMEVTRLEMGMTTYSIKQDFGADVIPINIAIKLIIPLLNFILTPIYYKLYKSKIHITKRVFKDIPLNT
jgi:predicted N-acyltransferase